MSTPTFYDATGAVALGEGADDPAKSLDRFTYVGEFGENGVAFAYADDKWGLLHADGSFVSVDHREPETHWDGGIVGFSDSGLAMFLSDHNGTVCVDADGRDVCRIEVEDGGRRVRLTGSASAHQALGEALLDRSVARHTVIGC